MAAPSAGAMLADMGADVIKVEPLTGDVVRGMSRKAKGAPDIDHSFHMDNRGKRSIAVALDRPDGGGGGAPADRPRRCVPVQPAAAPPGALRAGRGDAALDQPPARARDAVRLRARRAPMRRGRASTSPRSSGGASITDAMTEPGGVAPMPRPAQGDHTTGIAMVAAILAGLRVAERTGEGPIVDVSLFATAAWTMASDLAPTLVDGRPVTKRDRHHLISPLANRFRCARRPLDHPQHARDPLVGAVLQDGRAAGVARGRSVRDRQGPLRQHAGADRPARRGVRHPHRWPSGAGSSTRPG